MDSSGVPPVFVKCQFCGLLFDPEEHYEHEARCFDHLQQDREGKA